MNFRGQDAGHSQRYNLLMTLPHVRCTEYAERYINSLNTFTINHLFYGVLWNVEISIYKGGSMLCLAK